MKKKKKGNRIILFFISIIAIIWFTSGLMVAKPLIVANSSAYSQASEYSNNLDISEISTNTSDGTLTLISKSIDNVKELALDTVDYLKNIEPTYKINEKEINIPILIYHEITTTLPKNDIYKLYISPERFEENIVTLLDAGYTFITFDDLYSYYNGEIGLPEKVVLITADDGWKRKLYQYVPHLKKTQHSCNNICSRKSIRHQRILHLGKCKRNVRQWLSKNTYTW